VQVFEVDQPGPQAWKRQRLEALGYGVPEHLHLVPVDFESDDDWWGALVDAGFDPTSTAMVSSSGVSMYISKEATSATLSRLAAMAEGSIVAMTFMLPFELVGEPDRSGLEAAARGARASGTPWISFYTPAEIVALASDAGYSDLRAVATDELVERYLIGRDDLRPAEGEGMLLAPR
jgi:methyltransferase (TIGR00027 family)